MTSGRSMNQVMRRKPSASHCVTKPFFVAYRPSSWVFFCGTMRDTVSSVKASGTSRSVSFCAVTSYCGRFPSSETETSCSSSPSSTSGPEPPLRRTCSFARTSAWSRSEEHTSELQSLAYLVCRLLLEKKKKNIIHNLTCKDSIVTLHD